MKKYIKVVLFVAILALILPVFHMDRVYAIETEEENIVNEEEKKEEDIPIINEEKKEDPPPVVNNPVINEDEGKLVDNTPVIDNEEEEKKEEPVINNEEPTNNEENEKQEVENDTPSFDNVNKNNNDDNNSVLRDLGPSTTPPSVKITSYLYKVDNEKNYIYTKFNSFNLSNITVSGNYTKEVINNVLYIKDGEEIIKQYDIISFRLDNYTLGNNRITYEGTFDFNNIIVNTSSRYTVMKGSSSITENGEYILLYVYDTQLYIRYTHYSNGSYLEDFELGQYTLTEDTNIIYRVNLINTARHEQYSIIEVGAGNTISYIPSAEKHNAVLLGWYKDKELTQEFDFNTPINSDMNIYTKWLDFTFSSSNYSIDMNNLYVLKETFDINKISIPDKYTMEVNNNILTIKENGVVVKTVDIVNFKIDDYEIKDEHLILNDSTFDPSKISVDHSDNVIILEPGEQIDHDTLDGTYYRYGYDNNILYFEHGMNTPGVGGMGSENGIYQFGNEVTFETNSEDYTILPRFVKLRDKLEEILLPNYNENIFEGWFIDSGLTTRYDFNSVVNSNLLLYAKWAKILIDEDYSINDNVLFTGFNSFNLGKVSLPSNYSKSVNNRVLTIKNNNDEVVHELDIVSLELDNYTLDGDSIIIEDNLNLKNIRVIANDNIQIVYGDRDSYNYLGKVITITSYDYSNPAIRISYRNKIDTDGGYYNYTLSEYDIVTSKVILTSYDIVNDILFVGVDDFYDEGSFIVNKNYIKEYNYENQTVCVKDKETEEVLYQYRPISFGISNKNYIADGNYLKYYDDSFNVYSFYLNYSNMNTFYNYFPEEGFIGEGIVLRLDDYFFEIYYIKGEDGQDYERTLLKQYSLVKLSAPARHVVNVYNSQYSYRDVYVNHGEKINLNRTPSKNNAIFLGYYTDEEYTNLYDFDSPVTNNFNLYPKWLEIDSNGLYEFDVENELVFTGFNNININKINLPSGYTSSIEYDDYGRAIVYIKKNNNIIAKFYEVRLATNYEVANNTIYLDGKYDKTRIYIIAPNDVSAIYEYPEKTIYGKYVYIPDFYPGGYDNNSLYFSLNGYEYARSNNLNLYMSIDVDVPIELIHSITYYRSIEDNEKYISYYIDGHVFNNSDYLTYYQGKVFIDWYLDVEYNEKIEDGTIINQDYTLYARWLDITVDDSYFKNENSIFTGFDTFDINKVHVSNIYTLEYVNNNLYIKYNNEVIKSYDVVTLSSDTYKIDNNIIYVVGEFDLNKISITYGNYVGVYVDEQLIHPGTAHHSISNTYRVINTNKTLDVWISEAYFTNGQFGYGDTYDHIFNIEYVDAYRSLVTFDPNGGELYIYKDGVEVIDGTKLEIIPKPVKDGKVFAGWYNDEELTDRFDVDSVINSNITLYARWITAEVLDSVYELNDYYGVIYTGLDTFDIDNIIVPEGYTKEYDNYVLYIKENDEVIADFDVISIELNNVTMDGKRLILNDDWTIDDVVLYTSDRLYVQHNNIPANNIERRFLKASQNGHVLNIFAGYGNDYMGGGVFLDKYSLGHEVHLMSKGKLYYRTKFVFVDEYLNDLPELDDENNNIFLGWYVDEDLTIKFNPNSLVAKSMNLYQKWIDNVFSDDYRIFDNFLYTGTEYFNFDKVLISNPYTVNYNNNVLTIYEGNSVLREYDIVTLIINNYEYNNGNIYFDEYFDLNNIEIHTSDRVNVIYNDSPSLPGTYLMVKVNNNYSNTLKLIIYKTVNTFWSGSSYGSIDEINLVSADSLISGAYKIFDKNIYAGLRYFDYNSFAAKEPYTIDYDWSNRKLYVKEEDTIIDTYNVVSLYSLYNYYNDQLYYSDLFNLNNINVIGYSDREVIRGNIGDITSYGKYFVLTIDNNHLNVYDVIYDETNGLVSNLLDSISINDTAFDLYEVKFHYTLNTYEQIHNSLVSNGDTIQNPGNPEVYNYNLIFTGWYTDPELSNLYDFNTPINSNLDLYGGFVSLTLDDNYQITDNILYTGINEFDITKVHIDAPYTLEYNRNTGILNVINNSEVVKTYYILEIINNYYEVEDGKLLINDKYDYKKLKINFTDKYKLISYEDYLNSNGYSAYDNNIFIRPYVYEIYDEANFGLSIAITSRRGYIDFEIPAIINNSIVKAITFHPYNSDHTFKEYVFAGESGIFYRGCGDIVESDFRSLGYYDSQGNKYEDNKTIIYDDIDLYEKAYKLYYKGNEHFGDLVFFKGIDINDLSITSPYTLELDGYKLYIKEDDRVLETLYVVIIDSDYYKIEDDVILYKGEFDLNKLNVYHDPSLIVYLGDGLFVETGNLDEPFMFINYSKSSDSTESLLAGWTYPYIFDWGYGDLAYGIAHLQKVDSIPCTVNLELNGGVGDSSIVVELGEKITNILKPYKENSLFVNWYSNEELNNVFDFNTTITDNITLYAKFITFYVDEYTSFDDSYIYTKFDEFDINKIHVEDGYTLEVNNNILYIKENDTVIADIDIISLTYDGEVLDNIAIISHGDFDYSKIHIIKSDRINTSIGELSSDQNAKVLSIYLKSNNEVLEVFYADDEYRLDAMLGGFRVLYPEENTYYVYFRDNKFSNFIDPINVIANNTIEEPTIGEQSGYLFKGWYTDKELTQKFDFDTPIDKNMILYAKWSKKNYWIIGDNYEGPNYYYRPQNNIHALLNNIGYDTNNLITITFNDYSESNIIYENFDFELDVSLDNDNSVVLGVKEDNLYIQYDGTLYFNINSGYMFYNYFDNVSSIYGLKYVDTSSVKSMVNMFGGMSNLTYLDLSSFNTSNVVAMGDMFAGLSSIESLDLSNFDTSNVTDMSSMFYGVTSLETLDLGNFDTSNVTTMYAMFTNMYSLENLNISSFTTSNVVNMYSMFSNCRRLTSLNLENFDTSNVTDMSSMFNGDHSLEYINLSSFNTSNVVSMAYMFNENKSLLTLDLSSFDTSNVTSMEYMFGDCNKLEQINLSSFRTPKVTNTFRMFIYDYNLKELDLSNFDSKKFSYTDGMFYSVGLLRLVTFKVNGIMQISSTLYDKDGNVYSGEIKNLAQGTVLAAKTTIYFDVGYYYNEVNSGFYKEGLYGEEIGDLPVFNREGYTFDGWYNYDNNEEVTSDTICRSTYMSVYARWIPATYTVTWNNYDGSLLKSEEVELGLLPNYEGTPTRESDAQYTYTFAGWDKEIVEVTGDVTYTAVYSETLNQYEIKWIDGDGEVCLTAYLDYGVTPNYEFQTTKRSTDEFDYEFIGWDKEYEMVVSDQVYTALFNPVKRKYNISWIDYDGTLLSTEKVEYGTVPIYSGTPSRDNNAQYTYTFAGWDKEVVSVTGNATYIATYNETVNKYSVTFLDEDGITILKDATLYDYGTDKDNIIRPVSPTKVGTVEYSYTFASWTPEIVDVIKDAIYKATYNSTKNKYIVTWNNYDGSLLKSEEVEYGTVPTYIGTPNREASAQYTYTFAGWDKEVVVVTGNVTYTATYSRTINKYTVVFVDDDNTVLKGMEEYDYGTQANDIAKPSDPTKTSTKEFTYTFAGWNPEIADVVESVVYKATYRSIKNKYTITWNNYDGSLLKSEEVEYGLVPSYNGTPSRDSNAQYTYTFAGWDKEVVSVTGNATYTATYTETINKYSVTFLDEDNITVLKEATLYDYGTLARNIVKPNNPTKTNTAEYSYSFASWTPEIVDVIKDAIYKATYNSTKNKYIVTWNNYDGSLLKSEEVEYGIVPSYVGTPTREASAQYTYTFAGWDKAIVAVTGNVTYTATYSRTINKYTVVFVDDDNTVLKGIEEYDYGTQASDIAKPSDPTKTATKEYTYTFTGWNPEISDVFESVVYKATYSSTKNKYTVTWKDYDGTVLSTEEVEYGIVPSYNGTPSRENNAQYTYAFTGWDKNVVAVTGNVTYTATYSETVNKYSVTFVDEDGTTVLKEVTLYDYGTNKDNIVKPSNPTKTNTAEYSYNFISWTPEIVNVIEDAIYKATYSSTKNKYTVTWNDYDGSLLKSEEVEYGIVPSYSGTPNRENNAQYTYTFAGWDKEVATVTGNVTYTATYNRTTNKYTVKFVDEDNSVLKEEVEYDYGTKASDIVKPSNPTKVATKEFTYTFSGWIPEIVDVIENVIYKAIYSSTKNKYTVTWKDRDGSVIDTKQVEYGTKPVYTGSSLGDADYEFIGWYKDSGYNTPLGNNDVVTDNMTLFAKYNFIERREISVNTELVDFGTVLKGATNDVPAKVKIKNTGNVSLTLNITNPVNDGPFGSVALENNVLAPGEEVEITLLANSSSSFINIADTYNGNYVITGTTEDNQEFELVIPAKVVITEKTTSIEYTTHVQNIGWQSYVSDGAMAGTSGKAYRLEGIKIRLVDQEYAGNIEYRTHIQNIGWESKFKKNDEMSGTSGKAYRLEAIEIKLTGDMANHYDVYYRVHAENFGWLGWARNGEQSGTAGYAYRLEGIEIKLVKKGDKLDEYGKGTIFWEKGVGGTKPKADEQPTPTPDPTPDPNPPTPQNKLVSYTTHVQNLGWQNYVSDGAMAGTSGKAYRLEGIKIKLEDQQYSGNIEYRTHIQNIGWEKNFKKNDEMSGTEGKAYRLEAIEIKLTGEMAEHYDVFYRVHAENFGWLGWSKNGEQAGTAGYAYRLEGIEIVLMEKGQTPEGYGKGNKPFYSK